jgi:hypothetical protein
MDALIGGETHRHDFNSSLFTYFVLVLGSLNRLEASWHWYLGHSVSDFGHARICVQNEQLRLRSTGTRSKDWNNHQYRF